MPKNIAEKIQKLKLFNSKVEIFRRGRFVEQVFSPNKLGVTVNLKASLRFEIQKRGADEDAVLALVTPLRFFVQPRD